MKHNLTSLLLLPVAGAMIFATAAWARTYTLQPSSAVPGATGTVDAKAQKSGGNTDVSVKVEHLARPTVLAPPANNYVVWIEPQGGQPQNEGVLDVGDNEKGALKITTTASKFAVLVTAENEAHAQEPLNG